MEVPYRPIVADAPLRIYQLHTPWLRIALQLAVALMSTMLVYGLASSGAFSVAKRSAPIVLGGLTVAVVALIAATVALALRRHHRIEVRQDRLVVVGRSARSVAFPFDELRLALRTTPGGQELAGGKLVQRRPIPLSISFSAPGKYVQIDTALLAKRRDAEQLADDVERLRSGLGLAVAEQGSPAEAPRLRLDDRSREIDAGSEAEAQARERDGA